MKKTKAPIQAGELVVFCKGRWSDRVKKATPDNKKIVGVYVGKKGNKVQIATDFEYHHYFDLDKFRL